MALILSANSCRSPKSLRGLSGCGSSLSTGSNTREPVSPWTTTGSTSWGAAGADVSASTLGADIRASHSSSMACC